MSDDEDINNNESQKNIEPTEKRRGIGNKLKEKGKDIANNIKNAFKNGFKNLWKALPVKYKIIIIIIIIVIVMLAATITVLSEHAYRSSSTAISNFFNSSGITGEGATYYKTTGSLLMAKDEDIKKIKDSFLEDSKANNPNIYRLMSVNYFNGDSDNSGVNLQSGAIAVKDRKTLYEHLLNAEKYNFNRIVWNKYDRSKLVGQPEMQVDQDTKLQYPRDSVGTNLKSFADMARPYLQSWIIPYTLYVGILTDNRIYEDIDDGLGARFAYEMLSSGYHKTTINQYNLETYTRKTEQDVYDIFEVTVTQYVTYRDGYKYHSSAWSEKKIADCHTEEKDFRVVEDRKDWSTKYFLKEALMFDKYIKNEYQVYEYDLNSTPDEEYLTRGQYINNDYESPYSVPSEKFNYKYDAEGNIEKRSI